MKCIECEEREATHKDPRNPPIEEGKCLCSDCCGAAFDDMMEELEDEIKSLRREKAEQGCFP